VHAGSCQREGPHCSDANPAQTYQFYLVREGGAKYELSLSELDDRSYL